MLYCFSKSRTNPIWNLKMSSMFPKITFNWSSPNMSILFRHCLKYPCRQKYLRFSHERNLHHFDSSLCFLFFHWKSTPLTIQPSKTSWRHCKRIPWVIKSKSSEETRSLYMMHWFHLGFHINTDQCTHTELIKHGKQKLNHACLTWEPTRFILHATVTVCLPYLMP